MLRFFLRSFPVAVLLVLSTRGAEPPGESGAPPLLPLDDAIRTAFQNNRQIQASLLDVTKAVQATAEVGASRYPHFDLAILSGMALNPMHTTIPQGAMGTLPGIGPLPATDTSVTTPRRVTALIHGSAVQPVLQLYKISLGMSASRIGEALARENLRQSRQETAQQVRQAYYQIAQTQAELTAAETSLQFLTELSALMDRRLAEETVLRSDTLSVKANTAQQRYQLLALRNASQNAKESLNRLLGRDLGTEFAVEFQPLPSLEELDLAAARGKAIEQRPEIRKAKLQVSKAELDIRRERAEYLPNLSLQLTYLSFANINFAPQNVTSAGFLFE